MICPKCRCSKTKKNGISHNKTQHYKCMDCGNNFSEVIVNRCKILLLDIETAPILARVWRVWQENISLEQIKKDWFILCWSAKWLNSNEVIGERLTGKQAKHGDDKPIMKTLWKLFNEADIIIGHNGDDFDVPKVRTRFILNDLPPTSPYRTIDTVKIARKQFSFTHNKLDYLAQQFGFDRKLKTDFSLWIKCVEGDDKALQYMLDYNMKDVLILEEVYLKLRGYTKAHPNVNMFQPELDCANCGSIKIKPNGYYTTQVNKYRSWLCGDCGAYSRETKKSLISTAR